MRTKRKWLSFGTVISGLLVICLLALALNRGPLLRGFEPYEGGGSVRDYCLLCDETPTVGDFIGTALIVLFLLAIPIGHMVMLITLAVSKGRPSGEPEFPYACSACGHGMRAMWNICPYCGAKLGGPGDGRAPLVDAYVDKT
jgi:hypothetical protein